MDRETPLILFKYKSPDKNHDKIVLGAREALRELMIHRLEITDMIEHGFSRIEVTLAEAKPCSLPFYKVSECTLTSEGKELGTRYFIHAGKLTVEKMEGYLSFDNKKQALKVCNELNRAVRR